MPDIQYTSILCSICIEYECVFSFRYKGPLLDEKLLLKAAEDGASSRDLSQLVEWATKELSTLEQDHVNVIAGNFSLTTILRFAITVFLNCQLSQNISACPLCMENNDFIAMFNFLFITCVHVR